MKKKGGFTLIELMIVVAIIGILAAIAIPNFIRFQAKSKQSEAKTNLKAIFTAQKAYFGEKDKYVSDFKVVGFDPEPGNRYTYGINTCAPAAQAVSARTYTAGCIGQDLARFTQTPTGNNALTPGINGDCPNCSFNAIAIGNVDNDEEGDTWGITSIATPPTSLQNTCGIDPPGSISGGEPGNAYNDVSCP
ncbi:prepilin-type N-terminal cleavage/methylation domain-containing protein [Myxococcus stipitatus]